MLELLTMESPGLAGGSLNPRHPWNDAESQRTADRAELLKSRRAYYEDLSRQQEAEDADPQGGGSTASDT
jgi:hypothetical protein